MTKLLLKILIKLLYWLRDKKDISMDLNQNDKNDLTEWIEYLEQKVLTYTKK